MHDAGLIQRGVDILSFTGGVAGKQGAEDAHRRQRTGGNIGDRCADFYRRPAGPFAGDAHQAAHALSNQIEPALFRVRPGRAEAGYRAINQPRAGFSELFVADAVMRHRAHAVVFDKDIGTFDQSPQHRLAVIVPQINADSALVTVHHGKGRGFVIDKRRAGSDTVTVGGTLNLDDIGAHVGQMHAAGRRRHDVAQFDHPHTGKHTRLEARLCRIRHLTFL